mgnify:CR=1 FL=1
MPKLRNKIALLYRYLIIATKRLTDKQLMILLAIVVGLAAGFATFVFERALMFFRFVLTSWFDIDTASVFYLFYPVIGIIIATLFVKYVVRDNISEGVTRVLYAMSKKGSRIKPHNCYTSVVASATTIGFGGSVGPEAPIVLTGSAIGSNIGRFMRMNYKNSTLLLCCGAVLTVLRGVLFCFGRAGTRCFAAVLELEGAVLSVQAFCDTGFSVQDPLTGQAVVLVYYPAVRSALPQELRTFLDRYFACGTAPPPELRVRLGPCTTIAGHCVLPAVPAKALRTSKGSAAGILAAFCRPETQQPWTALLGSELAVQLGIR